MAEARNAKRWAYCWRTDDADKIEWYGNDEAAADTLDEAARSGLGADEVDPDNSGFIDRVEMIDHLFYALGPIPPATGSSPLQSHPHSGG